jgi:hypothetical protein
MALKENYKDDILDVSVNTKRKYRITENSDGTISLDDETVYTQEGDSFGASDMNAMAHAINNTSSDAEHTSYDNTTSGLQATNVQDAVDEINDNLTDGIGGTSDKFRFGTDGNGNYGYIKKVAGADTFFPFSEKNAPTIPGMYNKWWNIATSGGNDTRTFNVTSKNKYAIVTVFGVGKNSAMSAPSISGTAVKSSTLKGSASHNSNDESFWFPANAYTYLVELKEIDGTLIVSHAGGWDWVNSFITVAYY